MCSVSTSPHHVGNCPRVSTEIPCARKPLHTRSVCPKGAGRYLTPRIALALSASEHSHAACSKCLLPSQGIHQEGKPRKHFRGKASALHCAGWSSNESSAFCSQLCLHPSSSEQPAPCLPNHSNTPESLQHSHAC